ncbi:hypothetical protein ACVWXN_003465 [Bradyrhizobium sp. i1.4.4]
MVRVALRPTVASDLPHVIGEPLPFRIKAITAHVGDQVLGVGGLGYLPNGVVGAFVAMNAEGRKYPAAIHRAGLAAMRMIRDSGEPRVVAIADELVPGAQRWLARLGFRPVVVGGVTAYVWEAARHG